MGYHMYLAKLTGNNLFIKSMEIVERLLSVYLLDIVAFMEARRVYINMRTVILQFWRVMQKSSRKLWRSTMICSWNVCLIGFYG